MNHLTENVCRIQSRVSGTWPVVHAQSKGCNPVGVGRWGDRRPKVAAGCNLGLRAEIPLGLGQAGARQSALQNVRGIESGFQLLLVLLRESVASFESIGQLGIPY
jgi:hypothetical protein